MSNFRIKPNHSLKGVVRLPPSKSHTMRAILLASLATGESEIHHFLHSPDTDAMISACRKLGAHIQHFEKTHSLKINGISGKLSLPDDVIYAGNSGQVLRFVGAMSALIDGYTIFTGDFSIRHNRPMQPLLDGLQQLGAFAISTKGDGRAPVVIKGKIKPGIATLNGSDSQLVSGLLMAAAFLEGTTEIHVEQPAEKPWIDLTLFWLEKLGVKYTREGYEKYKIHGQTQYPSFCFNVPGDFSSAAFPLVAALITHSDIELHGLDMQDVQGDKEVIKLLQYMGAKIEVDDRWRVMRVNGKHSVLKGCTIDADAFIDAVPILAVLGCFAADKTVITNATIARKKESDRLATMTHELQKMGAHITLEGDELTIFPSALSGARVHSYQDHRIAMALSVAALTANGETIVEDVACVAKSYGTFVADLGELGANIRVV